MWFALVPYLASWLSAPMRVQAIIPGGLPKDFNKGDSLAFMAEKISSPDSPVTYDYFYLPFCKPSKEWSSSSGARKGMNLGQILKGDSFELTAIESHMLDAVSCQSACTADFTAKDVDHLINLINHKYEVSLSVDDLPAAIAMSYQDDANLAKAFKFGAEEYDPMTDSRKIHLSGYPLGQPINKDTATVVNHLALTVFYHHSTLGHYSTREAYRVVGFEVTPLSVTGCNEFVQGQKDSLFNVASGKASKIPFSFSVKFTESDMPWATRWDNYLKASEEETEIHWLSLLDSLLVTFTLGLMCGSVLLRTVHQDIARYNNLEEVDDIDNESGWKLLHGDVFRRPWGSRALAGFVGSGVQVIGAASVVIIGGSLGVLSPANRGSIGQAGVTLFSFFGIPAGYVAARLNRVFLENEISSARSLIVTSVTALVFPGVAFGLYLLANFFIYFKGGASVPFVTVFVLGIIWFFVSIPLTILGAYFGYRAVPIELPCRVNRLPRQIPSVPKFRNPWILAFCAGIPIISVAVTEMRSIMVSMVFHHFYYLIGYLVISFTLMLITTALISVVITYVVLLSEEWRWWWPAFWTGGCSGVYLFILGMSLVGSTSSGGFVDSIINFCYISIWSITLSLMLGSVGLLTTFCFVRAIFRSIRID
eukprot:GHVH01008797.1.p1 GENE.GHVH01008797.1~~GHVH01008797.1.p1  ORF type:complete len:649 (+),score=76.50 GHVH01008797.1:96-2042(+)